MIFSGLIGAGIAFLLLFKPGRLLVVRHILAIVLVPIVVAILTALAFQLAYPLGYVRRPPSDVYAMYVVAGIVASVVALIVGGVGALFWRRRTRAQVTS